MEREIFQVRSRVQVKGTIDVAENASFMVLQGSTKRNSS